MARLETFDTSLATVGGGTFIGAEVLFEMGLRAASGRDGEIDLVSAHMYFNLADQKGEERASFHRREVSEQMSKLEVARALRAAREWLAIH